MIEKLVEKIKKKVLALKIILFSIAIITVLVIFASGGLERVIKEKAKEKIEEVKTEVEGKVEKEKERINREIERAKDKIEKKKKELEDELKEKLNKLVF